MTARRPGQARRYPARYRVFAGFIVASAAFAAIFVALTLSAFHAPRPHDLPVGIVGLAAVTSRVEHALDSAAPGAFGWRSYPSETGARTGIAQREVDGALVASGPNLRLLVAQGGDPTPAQALTQAFGAVAARSGRHLVVADVVPPLPDDTQALSSFFVVLGGRRSRAWQRAQDRRWPSAGPGPRWPSPRRWPWPSSSGWCRRRSRTASPGWATTRRSPALSRCSPWPWPPPRQYWHGSGRRWSRWPYSCSSCLGSRSAADLPTWPALARPSCVFSTLSCR